VAATVRHSSLRLSGTPITTPDRISSAVSNSARWSLPPARSTAASWARAAASRSRSERPSRSATPSQWSDSTRNVSRSGSAAIRSYRRRYSSSRGPRSACPREQFGGGARRERSRAPPSSREPFLRSDTDRGSGVRRRWNRRRSDRRSASRRRPSPARAHRLLPVLREQLRERLGLARELRGHLRERDGAGGLHRLGAEPDSPPVARPRGSPPRGRRSR